MPSEGATLVQEVISAADKAALTAHLVGGPVRDLLLDRRFHNADISIEGDAITLAETVASHTDLRLVRHPRFGTATIRSRDFVLDLVTARSETYEQPGVLPAVSPGSIDDDLRRRDFTINAMALAISGPKAGEIIDPLDGRADLDRRIVRVLHDRSFQDDATRILRAVRYERRLGFTLDPGTERLLRRDVRYLDTISPARIHHEFARTFEEAEPERTLVRLHELAALTAIHASLTFTREQAQAFETIRSYNRRAARAACWPILCWQAADAPGIAERLALRRRQADAVAAVPRVQAAESPLAAADLANSRIVDLLAPFALATVFALACVTDDEIVRERTLAYLRRLRRIKPALDGDDIITLGAKQGPLIGDILRQLNIARLDGEVRTRADEERLVREMLHERL